MNETQATPEQIEYAAMAVQATYERLGHVQPQPWSETPEWQKDAYRESTRAAIDAYREGPATASEFVTAMNHLARSRTFGGLG